MFTASVTELKVTSGVGIGILKSFGSLLYSIILLQLGKIAFSSGEVT